MNQDQCCIVSAALSYFQMLIEGLPSPTVATPTSQTWRHAERLVAKATALWQLSSPDWLKVSTRNFFTLFSLFFSFHKKSVRFVCLYLFTSFLFSPSPLLSFSFPHSLCHYIPHFSFAAFYSHPSFPTSNISPSSLRLNPFPSFAIISFPSIPPFPSHLAGVALKIKASQMLIDWRLSGLP